jgi:polar amino acid transport system substrate-binding protein
MTASNDASAWRAQLRFAYLEEPPFCYRDASGAAAGCDVELARRIYRMAGGLAFEAVETEFSDLLPGLHSGRWQMTTGLFATDARRVSVAFSRPIWALHDGLLIQSAAKGRITGYRSIARDPALRLAVVADQVQHLTALRLGVGASQISVFANQQQAVSAVIAGAAAAYASVAMAHRGYLARHGTADIEVIDVALDEQPAAFGAFAFSKSNAGLRQAIDAALAQYLGSPEHRQLMIDHGFASAEIDRVL